MGMKTLGSVFQRLMDSVMGDQARDCHSVYWQHYYLFSHVITKSWGSGLQFGKTQHSQPKGQR